MATCENCWKAFEAGYGEAEKAYLATIESRDAELATLAVEATKLREALEETREQLERDFAIRCRCDFVTGLFAGIERCVGCRARDRIAAIERALGTTEASHA